VKALALALIFCIASCADPSAQPFGTDAAAGTGGAAAAAGGHGGASTSSTGGAGGASSSAVGGAGGAFVDPLSCSGCWQGTVCILPANQTIDVTGQGGEFCHPTPLNCTGQISAPCPTNTAPAFQLAWRGGAAYCCPIDACTYDACKPAVP
jgi:hypothetical protein